MRSATDLIDLPFDLFTRNTLIRKMVGSIKKNDETTFKILDVGGRAGNLSDFLPDDELHILDIRPGEESNYVLGDIINSAYKDDSFDVVISSDVYEHIPKNERLDAITEMLRISNNFVILGAPFDSKDVRDAEIKAFNYFNEIVGEPHPWLKEHIDNGLPSRDDFEHFLGANRFEFLAVGTNNISNWLLMQLFIFYSFKYGKYELFYEKNGLVHKVSEPHRFYNENFLELGDLLKPTYRTIYLIGKKGGLPKVDFKPNDKVNVSKYYTFETLIFKHIDVLSHNMDNSIQNLETFLNANNEQIEELNQSIQKKDAHIQNLETFLNANNEQIEELNQSIQSKDAHIQNLENMIVESNMKLNDIYRSTTWQVLTKYQHFVDSLLPHTTKRRHVYDLGIISIRIIVNDGFSAFLYKLKEKVRESTLDASKIALIQTNLNPPHIPLSLVKGLSSKFTFPTNNLNEIRILTATYQRKNSDLELHITNTEGQIIRKSSIKGHRIQDNEYTSFKFKPIKDSKEHTFIFKLISKGEPSAAVWHNESVTFPELALIYDDTPINGSIGFQVFANIGTKSRYDLWILKNEPTQAKLKQYEEEIQNFEYQPKVSIVTPVYNPDVAWIEAALESVINQAYGNWELCLADASTKDDVKMVIEAYAKKDSRVKVKFLSENKGISGNSNEALSLATGEYIGLLDHDDELSPDALYEVVKHLQTNRDADMIYSDEDKIDLDGNRSNPFFKPDWSPDMFLSCMYTCHFGVYNKKIIDEIGGFREGYDGSQDYDLVLRFIEKTDSIHHIPKILYHWRTAPGSTAYMANVKNYAYIAAKKAITDYMKRNNIEGEVLDGSWTGSYYLKRKILKKLLVSIIIPTKDNVDVLKRCIDSIIQKTNYSNYEIVIVNNKSNDNKTYDYFEEIETRNNVRILEYNEDFNFSAINNFAVQNSNGEVLVFLNDDTEIIVEGWLTAMLEHVQRSEVGVVGCKLLYPNNTIQHAGVILGITGTPGEKAVAGHSHKHLPNTIHGYVGRVNVVHNLSAVTAACMMLRKDVFEEVGGFDENLSVAFNDVDLCLKIREKGYLIVYTPYAKLYHHESFSRGYEDTPEKQERFLGEIEYIREKWGKVIDDGDPYYNPNLTLEREDFSIRV